MLHLRNSFPCNEKFFDNISRVIQIASGMKYLHEMGILHSRLLLVVDIRVGDLAARNLLLTGAPGMYSVKISGFT